MTADAWRAYRRGKLLLWGALMLYLPVAVTAMLMARRLNFHDGLVGVVAVAWMVGLGVIGLVHSRTRCPACGERFYDWKRSTFGIWSVRCAHCGATAPNP
jgi:hypothetical protein